MHKKDLLITGRKPGDASRVLIMLHGRGGTAEDILRLAPALQVTDYTIVAPRANNNTWYPFSFLAPINQNEPYLSSALGLIDEVVRDMNTSGVQSEQIYFLGFSQGACLSLEYVTRNARRWGGVIAFTGGLIGETIHPHHYQGDFASTPVFIGTSNPDPHVPVERVHATTALLKSMHANIIERVYPHMGHTINQDEIENARDMLRLAEAQK